MLRVRFEITGYYVCDSCESSVAHEEQYVHSLVANDGKFVKNQFALRHFRRDKVTGSYFHPLSSPNDSSSENDDEMINVEPPNDDNDEGGTKSDDSSRS